MSAYDHTFTVEKSIVCYFILAFNNLCCVWLVLTRAISK